MPEITERGGAFFLYRPRVGQESVEGLDDVQRLYVVLEPAGDGPFRRVEVGRKTLPPRGWAGRRHGWAFVDAVTREGAELGEATRREEYETKTRGRRVQPEDRPVAEGVYALVRHDDHVHLVFELDVPDPPGPPQEAFNLEARRSFVVEVKDPTDRTQQRRQPTSGRTEPLPDELQRRFGDRPFIPLDPPAFLDHEGVELLLMPAVAEDDPGVRLDPGEGPQGPEALQDLGVEAGELPTEPLVERRWT